MRLLHTAELRLQEFIGDSIPEYVILSHTWGEDEVTFEDMFTEQFLDKGGFAKLKGSCERAAQDGYKWIWIDTVCINKSSSAELTEAINSMYHWYQSAQICYAYIVDIESDANFDDFKRSRWFTRGWTLQELLAPRVVEFYAQRLV